MHMVITGGAGFIGANLTKRFIAKGHSVTLYDNFSRKGAQHNRPWLEELGATIIEGDVRDADKVKEVCKEADAVFHLAGQVAVTTSVKDPSEDFDINARGTFNVLEAARASSKKPKVFFSSTNKVYGGMEEVEVVEGEDSYSYKDYEGIPETFPLDFHSPYGCSKGAADQYTRDYYRIFDVPTVVFRQSCIYGCHQFGIEDQGWVAWFVIQAVKGNTITIYGDGKQVRDVLFMDDLSDAFEQALATDNTNGQIYNIGGGPTRKMSLRKCLRIIEDILGKKINVEYKDPRPGDQKVYISDISKAQKDFGWTPKTSPEEGIKQIVEWVKEHQDLV